VSTTLLEPHLRPAPPPPVPVLTVVALAALMAYGDGFLLTSLQGAVGDIARSGSPFASWLRDSSLLLPLFALAVLGALALARRRFGPRLDSPGRVVKAAIVVALAGSVVGIGAIAASSAHDYQLQSAQLRFAHATHDPAAHAHDPTACTGDCAVQRQRTLDAHVRAVGYAVPAVVVTDLMLVGWVIALRGGRIDVRTDRRDR
jgi:hypothetical protein